jgi:hypothetical protein
MSLSLMVWTGHLQDRLMVKPSLVVARFMTMLCTSGRGESKIQESSTPINTASHINIIEYWWIGYTSGPR